MSFYEITVLVNSNQSERILDIIKSYKIMIEEEKGKMHNFTDLGKKELAYQIKKIHKAHYVIMTIECTKNTLTNLISSFKFNTAVIRSLILKINKLNVITNPNMPF